jgi:hypothetical protein
VVSPFWVSNMEFEILIDSRFNLDGDLYTDGRATHGQRMSYWQHVPLFRPETAGIIMNLFSLF